MVSCAYITHLLARTSFGGAENQALRTMEEVVLNRPEYAIKRFDPWVDSLDDFDIIHLFSPSNFPLEGSRIAQYAQEHGIGVVTTPIFYHDEDYRGGGKVLSLLTYKLQTDLRFLLDAGPLRRFDPYRSVRSTLAHSDLILPNSITEKEEISRFFTVEESRFRIIPMGVDLRFEDGDASLFSEEYGMNDVVLFAGRIQPVKNVIGLIKGFLGSGIEGDLVLLGGATDRPYFNECKASASERVHFLPPLPPGSDMLASAYKAAKVVALPSFHETVGMTALEGALAGANIVVTEVGGAREYLGEGAWYVRPNSPNSIASGLRSAFQAPRQTVLRDRVKERCSWTAAGRLTAAAYDEVLAARAATSR